MSDPYYLREMIEFRATNATPHVEAATIDGTSGTFRFVCVQAQERSRVGARSYEVMRAVEGLDSDVCVAEVSQGKVARPDGTPIDVAALDDTTMP